jgi:hypothetical protein
MTYFLQSQHKNFQLKTANNQCLMDSTIYFVFYYALEREYFKSKPYFSHCVREKTTKIPLFANHGLKIFLKRGLPQILCDAKCWLPNTREVIFHND